MVIGMRMIISNDGCASHYDAVVVVVAGGRGGG